MSGAIDRVIAASSPALAGDGLDRLHAGVRADDPSCLDLAIAMVGALALTGPAARGLRAVAAAADAMAAHPFHNPGHAREVAANWWLLARSLDRPAEAMAEGLQAAFGHDLQHDGRGNGDEDFRLEARAAEATAALLRGAGVDEAAVARVGALILATDTRAGYAALAGGPAAPALAPLAEPVTHRAAAMLRDADLLPSAGTSVAAYRARTAELVAEGAVRADQASARFFFDRVVERRFLTSPAQVFAPNLAAIIAAAGLDGAVAAPIQSAGGYA